MSASITATVKTWHPASQTDRNLKVARFPASTDPYVLLKHAREMLPKLRPHAMSLCRTDKALFFYVSFGADRKGTEWSVWFPLHDSRHHAEFAYLMLRGKELDYLMAGVSLDDSDGDGGETLEVPKVAIEAFNDLTATAVH